MDDKVLAACAAFLDRDEAEVEGLHEAAELLPALLAGIGLILRAPRTTGELRAIGPWIDAVRLGWGATPFTLAELIAWSETATTPQRRQVFETTRQLCGLASGAELSASKLAAALREVVPRALEDVGSRRGATLWSLRN